jgi:hypothetical protein
MTLRDFNNSYSYKPDINYDDWAVCKPDSEGNYKCDCESMVITIKKLVPHDKAK